MSLEKYRRKSLYDKHNRVITNEELKQAIKETNKVEKSAHKTKKKGN